MFEHVARTNKRVFLVGAGAELLLANAIRDGFVEISPCNDIGINVTMASGDVERFPMSYVCGVTDEGVSFVEHYSHGAELE